MTIRAARCIAKRETLLFEAEGEGVACSRRFLSETRTEVYEGDVVALLTLLDQVLYGNEKKKAEAGGGGSSGRNQRVCVVPTVQGMQVGAVKKTVVLGLSRAYEASGSRVEMVVQHDDVKSYAYVMTSGGVGGFPLQSPLPFLPHHSHSRQALYDRHYLGSCFYVHFGEPATSAPWVYDSSSINS